MTSIWEDFYLQPLTSCVYEVERSDARLDQQGVLKDVVQGIYEAKLIIADLTELKPNVVYELGIAHALNKPVVMTTRDLESLPFDLRSYRVIQYGSSFHEGQKLIEDPKPIGREHLKGTVRFGNPVTDYLTTDQLASPNIDRNGTAMRPSDGNVVPEDATERGILDYFEDFTSGSEYITTWGEELGSRTLELGALIDSQVAQVESQTGTDTEKLRRRNRIAEVVAGYISNWATSISASTARAKSEAHKIEAATENVFTVATISQPEDAEHARQLVASIRSSLPSITESREAIASFREQIGQLKPLSRSLRTSSSRAERAMDEVMEVLLSMESVMSRIVSVLEERLNDYEDEIGPYSNDS